MVTILFHLLLQVTLFLKINYLIYGIIDGLDDGDYVTAQIVGGDLTAANLSVWGEVDGYMTDAHNSDKLSWPYLNHDAIAIDTFNVAGDHALGDFTYTLNIITDWKDVGANDYEIWIGDIYYRTNYLCRIFRYVLGLYRL